MFKWAFATLKKLRIIQFSVSAGDGIVLESNSGPGRDPVVAVPIVLRLHRPYIYICFYVHEAPLIFPRVPANTQQIDVDLPLASAALKYVLGAGRSVQRGEGSKQMQYARATGEHVRREKIKITQVRFFHGDLGYFLGPLFLFPFPPLAARVWGDVTNGCVSLYLCGLPMVFCFGDSSVSDASSVSGGFVNMHFN